MAVRDWKYKKPEDDGFGEIPVGDYRCRIKDAVMGISKSSGNDMITLTLELSGKSGFVWNYITFLEETPEITNSMLNKLFDSFGIEEGNFDFKSWIGKVGACRTKNDDYGTKVAWFIAKAKQGTLPAWKEPTARAVVGAPQPDAQGFAPVPKDDDCPF